MQERAGEQRQGRPSSAGGRRGPRRQARRRAARRRAQRDAAPRRLGGGHEHRRPSFGRLVAVRDEQPRPPAVDSAIRTGTEGEGQSSSRRKAAGRSAELKRPTGAHRFVPPGRDRRRPQAQIPGVAQRRLVLAPPGALGQARRVEERESLSPEAGERMLAAGDRMDGGEGRAGQEDGVFGGLRRQFRPRPGGKGGNFGGEGRVIRARDMAESSRSRRFWRPYIAKPPRPSSG